MRIGLRRMRTALAVFSDQDSNVERVKDSDMNDFAIHDKLAKKLVLTGRSRGKYPRRKAFAAGLITGKERSKSRSLLKDGKSALRDVAKAKPYWAA
jgi:hypothetical protein